MNRPIVSITYKVNQTTFQNICKINHVSIMKGSEQLLANK